jgi:hypothetical protein
MKTDIIVYGCGYSWRLQGDTDRGQSWLKQNAGMRQSDYAVTLARETAIRLCAIAGSDGLFTGAASYY